MATKTYLKVTGIIFAIIAMLHLLRLIYQWPAVIGAFSMPMWLSCAAVFVTSALFIWAFLLLRKQ